MFFNIYYIEAIVQFQTLRRKRRLTTVTAGATGPPSRRCRRQAVLDGRAPRQTYAYE